MTDEFLRNVELYKRGLFQHMYFTDEITKQGFQFHPKQIKALEYLNDDTTSYVGYGGAARGGKSALISLDALFVSYAYPETANLIGRKNLTTLWETTWKTLLRMMNNFGFAEGVDYKYNGQRHELTFENKSLIIAKNLELKPSDTEATEFGSLEILRAYVDQSEHVPIKIIEKVGERVGSHFTTTQYNLKGKVLEAFNPSGSHVKRRYWTPFKSNNEKTTRKMVQALPSDNPGREAVEWVKQKEKDYLDGTMSKVEYQKQIKGNFDYDDDRNALCSYDDIVAIFKNNHIQKDENNKYITADIARLGSDKAIIAVWYGWVIVEFVTFDISKTTDIQKSILALRVKHGIAKHNCIADEDGVGGGVVDNCGIKGFVNGSKPIQEKTGSKDVPQYKNLKTQCGYKFATIVNQNKIHIECELSSQETQEITEEIEQLRSYKLDDDGKLRLKPKKDIKEDLGRSPDWLDTLFMRIAFDLNDNESVYEYQSIESIPDKAIQIASGISLVQSPSHYCLVNAYIHESNLYLDEILHDNTLSPTMVDGKNSLVGKLNEIGFDKDRMLIGNSEGATELKDLRKNQYKARGVKNMLLEGIKGVNSYDLKVTNTSYNLINALDTWCWKNEDNGKPSTKPEGTEPEPLTAIRNIALGKALWQHLIPK